MGKVKKVVSHGVSVSTTATEFCKTVVIATAFVGLAYDRGMTPGQGSSSSAVAPTDALGNFGAGVELSTSICCHCCY